MENPERPNRQQTRSEAVEVMFEFGIAQGIIEQLAHRDDIERALQLAGLCAGLAQDGATSTQIDEFAIAFVEKINAEVHEDARFVDIIAKADISTEL